MITEAVDTGVVLTVCRTYAAGKACGDLFAVEDCLQEVQNDLLVAFVGSDRSDVDSVAMSLPPFTKLGDDQREDLNSTSDSCRSSKW